jgi:F0F1-type ATP synthase membrane subunit c/vacuolar-type H+-ATPase subunit K
VSADQYGAESGMDDSGMDFVGASFLVGLVHLVVCVGIGIVAHQYPILDEGYGVGG